jgi:thiosulfate/3-mercaptopyruvate sulfurtransferase
MSRRSNRITLAVLIFLILSMSTFAQERPGPGIRSNMLVSTDWLAQHVNDPGVIILHVGRYRGEYDREHIPGARFIPSYELVSDRQELSFELPPVADLKRTLEAVGVGNTGRIIVYGMQAPPSTTRVYFTLDYLGLGDRVALLDGGIEKWKTEKRDLSTVSPKITTAKLDVHPRPELVAKYEDVRKIADSPDGNVKLVDARPMSRYKDGHLAGAVDEFWMETIVSREMPTWKPAEEIRKMYEQAGVEPGSKVITYCEVGQQASHAYFTAKYLGYDVALYDGSYDEWTSSKNAPVVKGDARR